MKSLIDGSDGHTRRAILTVISPGEKRITVKRPLQRLYPLEIKDVSRNHTDNDNELNDSSEKPEEEQTVGRQRRATAIKAREQLKAIALCEQEDKMLN